MTDYENAANLARLTYEALPDNYNPYNIFVGNNPAADWKTQPDGCETITWHGWKLRIVNDPDDDNPFGLSWWLDSPDETATESGGWESLTYTQSREQASRLAAMLTYYASREVTA